MYIFQVSGRYTSRPDSRHHATSGCHTRGSWRSLHPDPLAYNACSPDYHQKFKYPARLFANTSTQVTPDEYIRIFVIILKIGWCRCSVLLRLRRFRDARIDPSRQASTDEPNTTQSCCRKASNIKQQYNETLKTEETKTPNLKIPCKIPSGWWGNNGL